MVGPRRNAEGEIRLRRALRLAEAALGRYGLQDTRCELLRDDFVQVFRVASLPHGKFALRMYALPRSSTDAQRCDDRLRTGAMLRSPETLRAQLSWLSALGRETDLLVPEPVPMPDGSHVGYVSVEGVPERRHFVLLSWVPGKHRGEDLTPHELSLVGSFMARLHNHAERHRVSDPSALPRWDWHWPFGESAHLWSVGEAFYSADQLGVFEEAAQRVRGDLEALGYGKDVFGLIHRDLNLDNVVFHDGAVGAIDFDLCGLGHYLLDLAVPLHVLRRKYADRCGPMREALLEGYGRERPLPRDYQRHLKALDVLRRVAAVNRDLELLSSEATRDQARGHRFLRNSATWLQRNYL